MLILKIPISEKRSKSMPYVICFFCFLIGSQLYATLDLDIFEQEFIIETKQLIIPEYPDAFNPCIVRWNGRLLMTFRSRDFSTQQANIVGLTWLDEDFSPVGSPYLLQLEEKEDHGYIQDPRIIVVKDVLYLAYSDLWEEEHTQLKKRKMFVAEIDYDGVRFLAKNREVFLDFEGDVHNKFEKNWVPFDYQGQLLLAYSLSPHKIFYPLFREKKCHTLAWSENYHFWNWGILRGGTPALLMEEGYLAFFHSSKVMKTLQSEEKGMYHYVMGAYLFEPHPPFNIQKMSPKPIISKKFYNGKTHPTWKPLRVIFPCGFVYDEEFIWVSYGRQDYESWIVKFDRKALLDSLIPLQPKN